MQSDDNPVMGGGVWFGGGSDPKKFQLPPMRKTLREAAQELLRTCRYPHYGELQALREALEGDILAEQMAKDIRDTQANDRAQQAESSARWWREEAKKLANPRCPETGWSFATFREQLDQNRAAVRVLAAELCAARQQLAGTKGAV